MRILIAGTGRLGVAVMTPLLGTHHQIVGVIVNGRGKSRIQRQTLSLQQKFLGENLSPLSIAVKTKLPVVWLDNQNDEEIEQIKTLKPDLIITCGFSLILKEVVLAIPSMGCINVHSSLLPKHRGASPFAHVIMDGDTESGVTWHVTTPGIDDGPILAQESFSLHSEETGLSVYMKSCETTRLMAVRALESIEKNGLTGIAQNEAEATYDPRMTVERARIDWSRPADEIERLTRGALAYHHTWFYDKKKKIHLTKATVVPNENNVEPGILIDEKPPISIACGIDALAMVSTFYGSNHSTRWPSMFRQLKRGERIE